MDGIRKLLDAPITGVDTPDKPSPAPRMKWLVRIRNPPRQTRWRDPSWDCPIGTHGGVPGFDGRGVLRRYWPWYNSCFEVLVLIARILLLTLRAEIYGYL
jgi:hypothetical protein